MFICVCICVYVCIIKDNIFRSNNYYYDGCVKWWLITIDYFVIVEGVYDNGNEEEIEDINKEGGDNNDD